MGSVNYRLCKRLIVMGRTDGMEEKLNSLMLFDCITVEEYKELMEMLTPEQPQP